MAFDQFVDPAAVLAVTRVRVGGNDVGGAKTLVPHDEARELDSLKVCLMRLCLKENLRCW